MLLLTTQVNYSNNTETSDKLLPNSKPPPLHYSSTPRLVSPCVAFFNRLGACPHSLRR